MKKIILLGSNMDSYAQLITIKDQDDYQPLTLVILSSETHNVSALTNANGSIDIGSFQRASRIDIRRINYPPQTVSYDQLAKSGKSFYVKQAYISLDQVVVTANRWRQPGRDVPARITTISEKEAVFQNPPTAADLRGQSGEVFIQKSQQGGVMSFYTLTPQFAQESKPRVSGSAVVRYASANSELTGHAAVSVGWEKWALATSVSLHNFGDMQMGRHGPYECLRPEYVLRVNGEDKVIPNLNPLVQRSTVYSQLNLTQKVRFKSAKHWDLSYGFHYSATSVYSRYDRLLRYRRGLPRSAEWNYGPQNWMMNNLTTTHSASGVIYEQMTIRLAHQFFKESRIDRDLNDPIRRTTLEKVNAFSINIDFSRQTNSKQKFSYGLEAVGNDVVSTAFNEDLVTNATLLGAPRYPKSTWASHAAYLTYQLKTTDKVTLQGGTRYNQYVLNSQFDIKFYPFLFTSARLNNGSFTGSLGLVYNPSDSWNLSANLSTGFRSPNVDDAGKVFESTPGSVVILNPALKAEYVYNAEVSLAKLVNNTLKVDLKAYYNLLDNALVRRSFTMNGRASIIYNGELSQVQAVQNAAKATVYGLQAGLEINLPAGFRLPSQLTYQKGDEEFDDGRTSPLRHAAPWFGITRFGYSTKGLQVELYDIYNGEVTNRQLVQEEQGKPYMYAVDSEGKPYSPGWYTLNAKAQYQLTDYFAVNVGLENFTDQG
ncbi:TonB-dependent receptor plug domain-containing protein [Spirosoma aerophilum]